MATVRQHHPILPGYWLHPIHGEFPLRATQHHVDYFTAHKELFGDKLNPAFSSGWVSIRRWVGTGEIWALRYDYLAPVADCLEQWAARLLNLAPHEDTTPVVSFPAHPEPPLPDITIGQIAAGKLQLVVQGRATAPAAWTDYVWARHTIGYLRSIGVETSGDIQRENNEGWIGIARFRRCGGQWEKLQDSRILDQTEYDAMALLPWIPASVVVTVGIAGGEIVLPAVHSLEEAIAAAQDRRRDHPAGNIFLRQPNIRSLHIQADGSVVQRVYRPLLEERWIKQKVRSFRVRPASSCFFSL